MNKTIDKNKKTVIFDFDGTIADTFEHLLDILDQYSGDFGVELSDKKLMEDLRSIPSSELFKKFGIPKIFIPFLVRKIQKNLSKSIDKIYPFSDLVEVLPLLKDKYNLGIVTSNSTSNVVKFLKKENIDDAFNFVYGSLSLFGKNKLIDKVLKSYKISKDDIVYIGDESRDVDAANNAGVKVISVGWGFNSGELLKKVNKDNYIDSPKLLLKKLDSIFKSY